tara:strand:+ start:6210 stop:6767 length:558 start_codon:yes stop_codon:yes gene_type:complete
MAAPTNRNFLEPNKFEFNLIRLPNVNFTVQTVTIPGISLPETQQPTPFVSDPVPGDHLTFDQLNVTFKVDEELANFIEIFNWMKGLGFPETYRQHKDLREGSAGVGIPIQAGISIQGEDTTFQRVYSDASLIIYTNANNPNFRIMFRDCWPTSLSDVQLTLQDSEPVPVEVTAGFRFRTYDIESI